MLNIKFNVKNMMLIAVGVIAFSVTVPAMSDGAGAFLGGIAVAKIGQSVRDRNDYEEDQAYYAQQQAQAAQQQADAAQQQPQTAEEKIAQLDRLAAGGYISPEEYKSRKKAILDSM
jgi:membrane protease subunit (stomatin/prohibitin family)